MVNRSAHWLWYRAPVSYYSSPVARSDRREGAVKCTPQLIAAPNGVRLSPCGATQHGNTHKPEVISGLLTVFLRAVETTLRQRSSGAPPGSHFGAVAFVHRFGSYLDSHVHFHVLVTDDVFSAGEDGEAVFHSALDQERRDFEAVQAKMRHRGLR